VKLTSKFKLTTQIDNARTRVNHMLFPAMSETDWHEHARDYVIIPMQDAELIMVSDTGIEHINLTAGECYYRDAGVKHNVKNLTSKPVVLIEVEVK